jgi:TadE-like protein
MRLFYKKKSAFTKTVSWAEQGAAAVEFAIILPVLILFLFGMIELSILLFDNSMINHSVRVGARTAALYKASFSPEKNLEAAENAANLWCQHFFIKFRGDTYPSSDTVPYLEFLDYNDNQLTQAQFDHDVNGIQQGDTFRVRLTEDYPYSFLVLFSFIGLGPVDLNTEVLARRE